ncbi:hypothetical protein PHYBOEH_011522 [Phytophthora boehmeriae]|uniref:Uncharacterized protein n=1 Tax=Phytophthora boehmeriae TaxID=109152 RepID=A0A8T1X2R3_9STRA|nr:hypothetical protein PHYBOEH_011522 [Phytophthora boehmeriae]
MVDDNIAAEEIARQIAALRPRVQGSGGVMAYLEKPPGDKRADVNKLFLASTIRGVDSHNRRQEEDKCWTLRRMERKLDESRGRDRRSSRRARSRSRSRDRQRFGENRRRRRSPHRSRSRSPSRRCHRSRSHSRNAVVETRQEEKQEDDDERDYWARKKAEKTRKIWENLDAERVLVENAPEFSPDESDDDDVKPQASTKTLPSPESPEKKHKRHKKHKKHSRKGDKQAKKKQRSRSRS